MRIKDLNKKIDKRSKTLLQTIKKQIDQRHSSLCTSVDRCIKKEKETLKGKSEKLLKHIDGHFEHYEKKVSKLKRKLEKISRLIGELESNSIANKTTELRQDVVKTLKQQNERYSELRNEQKKLYKVDFERIHREGESVIENGAEQLKKLL
ncbi:hypothetical protein GINT2_001944 [Glugoides intestinalis]